MPGDAVASLGPAFTLAALKSIPLLYTLALVAPAVMTAAAVPFWRRWCRRVQMVDHPGARKIHSQPIPLAGGLAAFTGLALVVLLGVIFVRLGWVPADSQSALTYGLGHRRTPLIGILLGAFGMLLLGGWDDWRELPALPKFAGQAIIALLVAATGVRITLFIDNLAFSYAITMLWILTVTNALNFNDNMNGLCAGLGAIAAASFGSLAAANGQYLVAILAFAVTGTLLGYLPFNFPRASIFLGDSGSHLVGFLLAIIAILPHFYSVRHGALKPLAVLTPVFVLAVPLLDLLWVVALRSRMGKPFWVGDTNHFSHQLVRKGWSKPQAVLVLWTTAAIAGGVAFFYARVPSP